MRRAPAATSPDPFRTRAPQGLVRARLNASPPPLPPPSGKSCGSSGPFLARCCCGASTIVLAEFSPWSGLAGTEDVGRSPSLARLERVLLDFMAQN